MKKIALAVAALFLINTTHAQQKTGKYKTIEDYKQKKFSDNEEVKSVGYFSSIGRYLELTGNAKAKSAKNPEGLYVLILASGEIFKPKRFPGVEGGKIWGFKTVDGTYRYDPEEKSVLTIVKDAAICLYGRESESVRWEEDKDGNITNLTATIMNAIGSKAHYYISKTIDGPVVELDKKSLATMVQDDAKLAAYVSSKDYSKKDEIAIINMYNAAHKK